MEISKLLLPPSGFALYCVAVAWSRGGDVTPEWYLFIVLNVYSFVCLNTFKQLNLASFIFIKMLKKILKKKGGV